MPFTKLIRSGMVAAIAFSVVGAHAAQELYFTDFEGPVYTPGSINNVDGWTVEGSGTPIAEIVNDDEFAASGLQYVSLRNGAILDRSFTNISVLDGLEQVWVEGYFRGTGSDVTLAEADYPAIDASAIVHFSSVNGIEFLDGARNSSEAGTPVQSSFTQIDPNIWYKVSIRLDFGTASWDVWVNNEKQNESPLGFKSGNIERLSGFKNLAQTESAFDRFRVVRPIPGDANGDSKVDAADLVALMEIIASGSDDVIVAANASFDGSGTPTEADLDILTGIILGQ
ncbi:MAG: hypothetical protein JJU11_07150 [Candidatus Sumerlaeia bacterium]|nr:hypothetical protein [Candidatus Sumerlaeia bacterium]